MEAHEFELSTIAESAINHVLRTWPFMLNLTTMAIWNLCSALVCLTALFYSYRIYSMFKGGVLEEGTGYFIVAISIAYITFIISFLFNLAGIEPIVSYGLSVKDIGILMAIGFVALALRSLSQVWNYDESKNPISKIARG